MLKNSVNTTNVFVLYPDISKLVGYDKSNKQEPFYLLEGLKFRVKKNGNVFKYFISKNFTFDGCTLKLKLLWLLVGCPHTPEFLPAALIHDYFCKNKHLIDRRTATEIFVYVLICEGVNCKKAHRMGFWVNVYQKYIRKWE